MIEYQKKLSDDFNSSVKNELGQIVDMLNKALELNKIKNDIRNPFSNLTFKINRLNVLEKKLGDSYTLLSEWEQELMLAENPTKKKRSELEINNIKNIITLYEREYYELKNMVSFNVTEKISELRQKQFLARNAYDLERIEFEVKQLIKKYPEKYELYQLSKDLKKSLIYEKKEKLESENKAAPKRSFAFLKWILIIALLSIIGFVVYWIFF